MHKRPRHEHYLLSHEKQQMAVTGPMEFTFVAFANVVALTIMLLEDNETR